MSLLPDPGGEALLEPQLVPPGDGDEVPEPLVRDLVADQDSNVLLPAGVETGFNGTFSKRTLIKLGVGLCR